MGVSHKVPIFALSKRKNERLAKFDLLVTVIITTWPIAVTLTAFNFAPEKAKCRKGR